MFSLRIIRTIFNLTPLVFALSLATLSSARAQVSEDGNSTIVYPASFFDQFVPITALDMLDRIPGQETSASPGPGPGGNPSSGGRGLGSGSGGNQILINGKRVAGKNNQASEQLNRITADQVKEFQIIRGTSGDLDVRGSGQVVNVILFEELASTSISYQASLDGYQDGEIRPGGVFSISGQGGGFNYLISATSEPRYNNSIGRETSILGDFLPNDLVREEFTVDQTNNELSLNIGYDIASNSSIRFNALYGDNDNPTDVDRVTANLRTTPNGITLEREDVPGERNNWEIGGDYEFTRNNGHRFKLLAIANQDNRDATRNRFLTLSDGSEEQNLFLNTGAITEERIVRAAYTLDLFESQDLEFGIEGAKTTLDASLGLGIIDTTGIPSPDFGGLVPQTVTNANSTVEEIRFEPFLIHNWRINPKLSVESTLLYEESEISQSGDVSNERDFSFVKPKIDVRYDLTPTLQLRGGVERIVSQLSFRDFVAANDETDNDVNTLGGNAELRQQTQWRYTLNTEYRLPNDVGVLSGEFFYADHQDVIDRVDASTSEDNLLSANGNIGDGIEYGMNLNASMRMNMFDLPNLQLTSTFTLQDSEVTDPFTGDTRRFQLYNRGRFTFAFRHDIPEWRVNWGMQYFDRIDGGMFRFEVNDVEFQVGEPRVNFFSEYIDSRGITYRLDLGALTNGAQIRRRTRYIGRTSAGILEEIENRDITTGVEFGLTINGTF